MGVMRARGSVSGMASMEASNFNTPHTSYPNTGNEKVAGTPVTSEFECPNNLQ